MPPWPFSASTAVTIRYSAPSITSPNAAWAYAAPAQPLMGGGFASMAPSSRPLRSIVVAFLVGKGVVNSGLGARIGYLLVSRFGRSPLGLAYSIMATDAVIAPAFPSNTARSGVLFPIVYSLAENNGSHPGDESRHRIGAYLMLCAMVSLALSSGLWLTAMAANPAGVAIDPSQ